jgi:hypothetical protein
MKTCQLPSAGTPFGYFQGYAIRHLAHRLHCSTHLELYNPNVFLDTGCMLRTRMKAMSICPLSFAFVDQLTEAGALNATGKSFQQLR